MTDIKDGCVKPARGPIVKQTVISSAPIMASKEEKQMLARVGQEAPDFEVNAFVANKGFVTARLSDYKGKWIVLCFYPGDFTFV